MNRNVAVIKGKLNVEMQWSWQQHRCPCCHRRHASCSSSASQPSRTDTGRRRGPGVAMYILYHTDQFFLRISC